MRYNEDPNGFDIPAMYKVPYVDISGDELPGDRSARAFTSSQYGAASSNQRNRKPLYVVSFKCSRVGIFYIIDGTGLEIREGDIVIVEADRGQDLGEWRHNAKIQTQADFCP